MPQDDVKPWKIVSQRLLHSAACSASGVSHLIHQATDRLQRPQAPFAAITGGEERKERPKKSVVSESAATEESPSGVTEQDMTPEQLQQLSRAKLAMMLKKLQKKRVKVDGKRTNLLELARQIVRERKVKEVAGDEPQIRDKSHAELRASIPPEERRPGAYKMQLRPEEEEELALDLLARGMTFSPRRFTGNLLGGRRDLAFGIYGRADEARKLLDEKWSGLPLEYVMGEPEFFEDVLNNAAQLELTVMAVPVRPLPLAPLREDLCRRLTARLDEDGKEGLQVWDAEAAVEESPAAAYTELQNLADTFSDEDLRGSAIVDKQGNLVPDTHFIFSALPDFSLLAEVITPGTLRDRKTVRAGPWKSMCLTRAVFGLFLGPAPLDDQARVQAGQALLYFTNGFKLSDDPSLPNQAFEDDDGKAMWRKPFTETLEPSPDIFSLEGKGQTAQLVNNVERRRQVYGSLGILSRG